MHHQRDQAAVRSVGGIALLLGTALMPITVVAALYLLLTTGGRGDVGRGAVAFVISLIMASTLLGCGTQLSRRHLYAGTDIDTMRLSWAALLLVMVVGGVAAWWYLPPLTMLATFIVFLLLTIRGAVIRLSHQDRL